MDTASRKRAERLRKLAQGLKRYEFWLLPSEWAQVVAFIRSLRTRK